MSKESSGIPFWQDKVNVIGSQEYVKELIRTLYPGCTDPLVTPFHQVYDQAYNPTSYFNSICTDSATSPTEQRAVFYGTIEASFYYNNAAALTEILVYFQRLNKQAGGNNLIVDAVLRRGVMGGLEWDFADVHRSLKNVVIGNITNNYDTPPTKYSGYNITMTGFLCHIK